MNAGLPGTGIGGVFYLISALLMPFIELFRTLRGESSVERWLSVFRQLAMAAAILGGMWLMGLCIGMSMEYFYANEVDKLNSLMQLDASHKDGHLNVFHIVPIFMSLITLSTIVAATHMLRFMFRPVESK